jgi:hypothetical protein
MESSEHNSSSAATAVRLQAAPKQPQQQQQRKKGGKGKGPKKGHAATAPQATTPPHQPLPATIPNSTTHTQLTAAPFTALVFIGEAMGAGAGGGSGSDCRSGGRISADRHAHAQGNERLPEISRMLSGTKGLYFCNNR